MISEDQGEEDIENTNGDFEIELFVQNTSIVYNGLSRYYLKGTAAPSYFRFYGGNGAVSAPELIIEDLIFFHRNSSDFVVNLQQSIRGSFVSVGHVISKNAPPVIEVEAYIGPFIFD
ncbi:MAG: hypothetical protein ACJA1Z_000907 [Patiriisocius sp.]